MMIKIIFIISLISNLVACVYFPGDSAFSVQGKVVDMSGVPFNSCLLMLYSEDSQEPYGTIEIGSEFLETFIISPKKQNYFLSISCEEGQSVYKSDIKRLGSKEFYINPIDLGIIKLDRKN